jgi:DtxR family Mn-dependent transcriptional regulator
MGSMTPALGSTDRARGAAVDVQANDVRPEMLEVGSDRSSIRAREDYVKAIYQLGYSEPVKAADVARYLGVTPVSVSKAKRLLERDGLLERSDKPTDRLALSRQGRELAVGIIRRHRLLETFLYRSLDVPLELLHAEAERIEHVISDDIAERFAKYLDYPTRDPHGHVIPYKEDEDAFDRRLPSLVDLAAPREIRVVSLDDREAAPVRALADAGVLPGLEATLSAVGSDTVELAWDGHHVRLPAMQAALVRVALR